MTRTVLAAAGIVMMSLFVSRPGASGAEATSSCLNVSCNASGSTAASGGVIAGMEVLRSAMETDAAADVSRSAQVTPGSTVTTCGSALCLNGARFYPYGATFYSSSPESGILSNPGGAISLAEQQQLNIARATDWLNVEGPVPAATEPASWVALDRFVADAESANIKVALDLSDFATLLMKNCINPFTDLSDWDQFITYAAQRVNSVTGAAYGSDPEIAWVEFFGEPNEAGYPVSGGWHDGKYYTHRGGVAPKLGSSSDPAPDSNWGMAATGSGSCAQPLYYTSAEVTAFYAHVEATWTDLSSIPTLAGGLTKLNEQDNGGIDYQAIFANSDNDLCGFETYGAMEEWLSTGVTFCTDELNKPSLNVEWGYLQSMGDKSRAADFDAQFANNDQAGVAGNIFWNSGDQVQANSYDVGNGGIDPLTFEAVVTNAPATG